MAQAETMARQAAAQSGSPGLVPMYIMEFSRDMEKILSRCPDSRPSTSDPLIQ